MPADDPFDLHRFVEAQSRGIFERALDELKAGEKRSHWMWFIFPQIAGLGSSHMAQRYAIGSLSEAQAYLGHPILGPRLRECTRAVNAVEGKDIHAILGSPDDMKFRSSMTLFGAVSPEEAVFRAALDKYFDGATDTDTLERLQRHTDGDRR